jgi:hypothetical protein
MRVAAKLADAVTERISRIGRKDAVDREGVASVRIDDVVSDDPHVFERKEQALRTIPHAWRSVGSVIVVDGVEGYGRHDRWSLIAWLDGLVIKVEVVEYVSWSRYSYVWVWNKDSHKFAVIFCWQQWVCCTIESALWNVGWIANSESPCI